MSFGEIAVMGSCEEVFVVKILYADDKIGDLINKYR